MTREIKAGVVVQLKSGGPHMTVSNLHEWQGRTEANCDWFEGTEMQNGSFPLTSLKVVEETNLGPAVAVTKTAWS
jgi:uncharacterized protein YodC (DUF2158 family)